MTDAIGGYFSLELQHGEHYHVGALRLNTARNCLEYILRTRGYKRIYVPYYTCDAVLQPIQKLAIDYAFYHVNEELEPTTLPIPQDGEALLYTNYFGIKQAAVERLAKYYGTQLIVDNAQAFYAPRVDGIDTFYSARKFFGVADGGYLYTNSRLKEELLQDKSYDRMQHLLQRIDEGAEGGYAAFRKAEDELDNQPVCKMSKLTSVILASIDYEAVRMRRLKNFEQIDKVLSASNRLKISLSQNDVPMVYPYWTDDTTLRDRLIKNHIFVAKYWPNVLDWCTEDMLEYTLTNNIIPLPIDQRYGEEEMNQILVAL